MEEETIGVGSVVELRSNGSPEMVVWDVALDSDWRRQPRRDQMSVVQSRQRAARGRIPSLPAELVRAVILQASLNHGPEIVSTVAIVERSRVEVGQQAS
jgi:hypothetical protein